MEIVVASSIGVLTAGGVYLLLRLRTFPVILGLALLSYAVNVFLFASGRWPSTSRRSCRATARRPTPTRCRRRWC
jgi:multisubunit Na+/H+ antiporter MnhC subunit